MPLTAHRLRLDRAPPDATDPTNSANESAIDQAIRASLRAFEDDNHDGNDDHEEGGH